MSVPLTPSIGVRVSEDGRRRWREKSFLVHLLLLLLSCFSCVRLYVTPWTAAHQAPLSLGFSRQEYWSGLPFPSPMHACVLLLQLCPTLCDPWTAAHQAPLSMEFSRQEYWIGLPLPSPLGAFRDPQSGIALISPVCSVTQSCLTLCDPMD